MKRHIAIPLLCVVLVAALSIPVYAAESSSTFPYPENNITGQGAVTFTAKSSSFPSEITGSQWLEFGDMWIGFFGDPVGPGSYDSDYQVVSQLRFNLSVNVVGSFYIAVPASVVTDDDYGDLSSYRDVSLDYTVDFGESWPGTLYVPNFNSSSFDISSSVGFVNVLFVGFKDVPIGNYTITSDLFDSSYATPCFGVYASGYGSGGSGGSGGTDTDDSGTGGGSGSTGNSGYEGFNNIVDKFQNGNITYTEALDLLGDRYDFIHTTDIYQNLLYVNEYQMSVSKLNGLVSSSAADKSAELDAQMSSTVNQFADGSIDLKGAMDSLSGDFTSALSGAQTVEEAQAVTAVYQVKLLQLESQNQVKFMEGFDAVISDEEIQNAKDYYAAEDELVNAFDVAEFDSMLQFEAWYLQLPSDEAAQYKSLFDYLLNDSPIRLFVIIPLTMGLVTILLGTRMRIKPDSGDGSK